MKDTARLLLLCEYPTLLGGERSMLATLHGVREAGFVIGVAAPGTGPLAEAVRRHSVELVPMAPRADGHHRADQSQLREELEGLLRRWRPDLVHANSLSMGRLSGPVAATMGLPSLAHLRDIVRISARASADMNCHARLLAVSCAVREFHATMGLAAEKIHVLYNGVDLCHFRPRVPTGYLHHELGLAPGVPLVGTIGQIGLRKGQDVLLGAAALATRRCPEAHYLIVGARWSDKEESRRFEAGLHGAAEALDGHVHWLGVRDDVDRLLEELTLLVHPARQEPLGRVLLEAAACGVAVVATDVGGTREIFPEGAGAARLVPPDDPAAMAAAMEEVLRDAQLRSLMGAAARRRAEEAFAIRQSVSGLVRHYRAVLSG